MTLEEIGKNEAILEGDEAMPVGAQVSLQGDKSRFYGTITFAEQHEFGWRIGVEFSPLTPWSPETFLPEHLLDPSGF